jgi:hypothetical protein
MRAMEQVLQLLGAVLILAAFIGAQTNRMTAASLTYLGLNFVGSLILAVLAGLDRDLGFLLLETVWAIVSAWGLLRRVTA